MLLLCQFEYYLGNVLWPHTVVLYQEPGLLKPILLANGSISVGIQTGSQKIKQLWDIECLGPMQNFVFQNPHC